MKTQLDERLLDFARTLRWGPPEADVHLSRILADEIADALALAADELGRSRLGIDDVARSRLRALADLYDEAIPLSEVADAIERKLAPCAVRPQGRPPAGGARGTPQPFMRA